MKLEALNIHNPSLTVSCGSRRGVELIGRLISLVMVSHDCGIRAIRCLVPVGLEEPSRGAVEQFLRRNQIIECIGMGLMPLCDDEFGYHVLVRDKGFIVLRDAGSDSRYVIYLEARDRYIDLASRCAYLISNILGFTSFLSFEVRFSIYELLNNIIEHGIEDELRRWISVELENRDSRLSVSITDKGVEFDPTGDDHFDLHHYLREGKTRGLGLILIRRLAEKMRYRREGGYNKIFFEKSMAKDQAARGRTEEVAMAQLVVGEPRRMANGSYQIALEGDLDTKGALILEDLMSTLLEQKMLNVTFDFERVPFVSSAGVGILLGMVSALRDQGGEVSFVNVTPKVRSVFRLLNLDDYFVMADTEEFSR